MSTGGGIPVIKNSYQQDFWSDVLPLITILDAPGDIVLPYVNIIIPDGAIILNVIAMLKFRIIENTNVAINSVDNSQVIQIQDSAVASPVWLDAIYMIGGILSTAAAVREGGDVIIGNQDLSPVVVGSSSFNFQWSQAKVVVPNLLLYDVQSGIRVMFTF
jgi:hypothetical protein